MAEQIDSERLMTDGEHAAQFFAGLDEAAANEKLSAGGAQVNLLRVVLVLAEFANENSTGSSAEDSLAEEENEDTPASQREALKLGREAEEKAASENESKSLSTSETSTQEDDEAAAAAESDRNNPTGNTSSGLTI